MTSASDCSKVRGRAVARTIELRQIIPKTQRQNGPHPFHTMALENGGTVMHRVAVVENRQKHLFGDEAVPCHPPLNRLIQILFAGITINAPVRVRASS